MKNRNPLGTYRHEPKKPMARDKFAALAIVALIFAFFGGLAFTATYWEAGSTPVTLWTQQLRVGAASDTVDGTAINGLYHGTLSVGSSATTGSLTLTGISADARILHSISSGNSSGVFIETAVPSTNAVLVTLSGTPGATTTIDILAIEP